MTGDELERAIDFILKSHARADARIERNDEQLSLLAEQVSQLRQQDADAQQRLHFIADAHASLANAHTNLVRVLTQSLETQDRINKSLRAADVRQARLIASLGETVRSSDESLRTAMTKTTERLSQKVEALAEQTVGTDRRLEALMKIVEERFGQQ